MPGTEMWACPAAMATPPATHPQPAFAGQALNRGVLLLVGETEAQRICWVERAGLALDVRGPETGVHSRDGFRRVLGMRRPPVALDRYAVRALWIEHDEKPGVGAGPLSGD